MIHVNAGIDYMKGNLPMETTKTLGPASAAILLRLSAEGKTIFSIADAQAITNRIYKATAELLSQLVRKGWLVRLVPGKYLIVPLEAGLEGIPMTDRYVIAREVLNPLPYYVSHYSALELHQMTTNPVNTVYVTVPKQQSSRSIAGVAYRFVYAGSRSFWGYEPMWVTDQERTQVSDLEKTLLDCAVRPDLCGGLAELAKGLWLRKGDLDERRMVAYLQRLDHKAAIKRIGFLLETYSMGRPETIASLQSLVTDRYALLDPMLPDEGAYRSRWRLRINVDPEELKAIIWT
jgi:predicted transcriptional regulator of viral defense system